MRKIKREWHIMKNIKASKLYGVNAAMIKLLFVLYCIEQEWDGMRSSRMTDQVQESGVDVLELRHLFEQLLLHSFHLSAACIGVVLGGL